MSLLLRVAYDGTDFHGYARQDGLRTVQGVLEEALEDLYGCSVTVRGASRTDSGVHAFGQIISIEAPLEIPLEGVVKALSDRLPQDIVVNGARICYAKNGKPLHPRFYNLGKRYRYRIRLSRIRNPLSSRYEWCLYRKLDVRAMEEAAAYFVGEHDFGSFRAADCQAKTTIRRVLQCEVREVPLSDEQRYFEDESGLAVSSATAPESGYLKNVEIEVRGEAFLKYMVRVMVGTLVEIGQGKRPVDSIPHLLGNPGREFAGATAPPEGLTLVGVFWPDGQVLGDWRDQNRSSAEESDELDG